MQMLREHLIKVSLKPIITTGKGSSINDVKALGEEGSKIIVTRVVKP